MQNRADALYQAKSFLNAGLQYEDVAKELDAAGNARDRATLESELNPIHPHT